MELQGRNGRNSHNGSLPVMDNAEVRRRSHARSASAAAGALPQDDARSGRCATSDKDNPGRLSCVAPRARNGRGPNATDSTVAGRASARATRYLQGRWAIAPDDAAHLPDTAAIHCSAHALYDECGQCADIPDRRARGRFARPAWSPAPRRRPQRVIRYRWNRSRILLRNEPERIRCSLAAHLSSTSNFRCKSVSSRFMSSRTLVSSSASSQ